MQADEFEKKIKDKMEDFELVPDNVVWKQVSIKIEKEKKKRRILVYWLFAGILLLSGASGWWLINNDNRKDFSKNDFDKKEPEIENYKTKPNTNVLRKNFDKLDKVPLAKNTAPAKKSEEKNPVRYKLETKAVAKNMAQKITTKELIVNDEKSVKIIHNKENPSSNYLPPHRFYNPGLATKADTILITQVNNEKPIFKKDTVANTAAKNTVGIKKGSGNKINIGFAVFTGISDNISGLRIGEKSIVQNYASAPNSTNGNVNSGSGTYINPLNNFKKGFSYGFGIFAKTSFTKKISLSAGVNYHVYTAKTIVGNKVSQQTRFYDSSVEKAISVSQYFSPGSSVNYSNKYHFLQLPVNFWYQLNNNWQRPFLFSAGISPGFLISSNALHANPTAGVYYIDKQQFAHFQLSAQMGFSFPLIYSRRFLVSAEPLVQYSFTNASKVVADAKQHLFFTGLKASIIFK